MKKIFICAILFLAATQLKAQQSVLFKIKYLPDHNYQTSAKMTLKLVANLSGNKETIDKLNAKGIKQPTNADLAVSLDGNMKSGAKSADNSFPLNMDYKLTDISVKLNGNGLPIPVKDKKDIKVYGHINPDGQLKIDSAEGKKVNDTSERKMQQMMNFVHTQIKFPDKPLKPGDSFTQGMPINLPIKGNDVKIDATITYKLISISDGKAFFDLTQNLNANIQMKKGMATITGTGAGKMVYSIKDNFPLSTNSNFNVTMKANVDSLNVDGTATIGTDLTTAIN